MDPERRFFYLELPDETICMDVPAVPATKRFSTPSSLGYPTNMVYDTGQTSILRFDRVEISVGAPGLDVSFENGCQPSTEFKYERPVASKQLEPQGFPVNITYDSSRSRSDLGL